MSRGTGCNENAPVRGRGHRGGGGDGGGVCRRVVGGAAGVSRSRTVSWPVGLSAVVTPGSATNRNATGIDTFYGLDWNTMPGPAVTGPGVYGPTVVATFHLLQDYIQVAAIDRRSRPTPSRTSSSARDAVRVTPAR